MNLIYPLENHVDSYKQGKQGSFGFRRAGNRKHAGCDLYGEHRQTVYCMADSVITRVSEFWKGTLAVETQLIDAPLVIRYCEVDLYGFGEGDKLNAGDGFATIGKLEPQCMLHLEMYNGDEEGLLTQRDNMPYKRRSDLINPEVWLKIATLP